MRDTVFNHKRTKLLAYDLGVPICTAAGLVCGLWDYAESEESDGTLSNGQGYAMLAHVGWKHPDGKDILASLVLSGWLVPNQDASAGPVQPNQAFPLDTSGDLAFQLADWALIQSDRLRDRLRKRLGRSNQDPSREKPPPGRTRPAETAEMNGHVQKNSTKQPDTSGAISMKGGRGDVLGAGENSEDSEQKAKPSVALASAFEELRVLWNKTPGTIPCRQPNPDRLKKLSTRLKEDAYRDCWREALTKFPLPMFDRPPRGDGTKHWTPTIDWFLTPSKVVQIVEGKYDAVIDRDRDQKRPSLSSNLYDLLPQELETDE